MMKRIVGSLLVIVILLMCGTAYSAGNGSSPWIGLPDQKNVDYKKPIISINNEILKNKIEGVVLENQQGFLPVSFSIVHNALQLQLENELKLDSAYTLKIFMENSQDYKINFRTYGLPSAADNGTFRVIEVPAMPEKGFNYPFFITLPSNEQKIRHVGKKRYLLIQPNNTGSENDNLEAHIENAQEFAEKYDTKSIAEELWLPRLVPCFPRPSTRIDNKAIYTHALTRNAMLLGDTLKETGNTDAFWKDMTRLDLQLISMIDYATAYLNQYGNNVDTKKVFMWGYSASGNFVNRFTALHPERVKACIAGGTSNMAMLPAKSINGYDLDYPLGINDYKQITGREFDLKAFNNVAQLIYEGDLDTNDTYNKFDCFSDEQNKVIKGLLGERKYPDRWNKTMALFNKAGGKAMFAIYKGAGHQTFYKSMSEDYVNFFEINRDSSKPLYPAVEDPSITIVNSSTVSGSIVKNISKSAELKVKPIHEPKSIALVTSGIRFRTYSPSVFIIYIDRNELPKKMRNYTSLGVLATNKNLDLSNQTVFSKEIAEAASINTNSEKFYAGSDFLKPHVLVTLFTKGKKAVGYYYTQLDLSK